MTKKLSDNQNEFMIHLLSSKSIGEASKKTGIATSTGYGYMQDEYFKSEYERLKREAFEQATAKIVDSVDEAVEVLREVMADELETGATRVQAARAIISNAFKSYEMQEVQERLDELEKLIKESQL